jgi:hypothetical protein
MASLKAACWAALFHICFNTRFIRVEIEYRLTVYRVHLRLEVESNPDSGRKARYTSANRLKDEPLHRVEIRRTTRKEILTITRIKQSISHLVIRFDEIREMRRCRRNRS